MTVDEQIEELARSVVPDDEPWEPLAMALKNAPAMTQALEDPYWADLKAQEAAEHRGDEWTPPDR